MKYAVIKTGGQQLKVSEGETVTIAKLAGKEKDKIVFAEVLMIVDGDKVNLGQPLVKNSKVTGEIVEQIKDKKIRVVKFKAKSRYRRAQGHRQQLTKVLIGKISTTKS
jgi:large subunit ribosomal protein L21